MVDKVTFAPVTTFTNDTTAVTQTNANYVLMQNGLDNTISRDGTQPNQMNANLDMNSNRILNLAAPGSAAEPLRLEDAAFFASGSATFNTMPVGGTVGQVLTKNSSGNYDTSWQGVASNAGNPTAKVGLTAVNGVATTVMRSDAAPPLDVTISPTWTGFHSWTTAKSATPVINITQQGLDNPGIVGAFTPYNSIIISNDNNNFSNQDAQNPGLYIQITSGPNANVGASHYALQAGAVQGVQFTNHQGDHIGGSFFATASFPSQPATGGGFYGLEAFALIQNGATSTPIASGGEFDVLSQTGCAILSRFGIDILTRGPVQGSVRDCAIGIGSASGSWKTGILLTGFGGINPLDPTVGTILAADTTMSMANGINLTGITFSGNAFASTGYTLNNIGTIGVGNNITPPAGGTGPFITMGNTGMGFYIGTGPPSGTAFQGSIYINTAATTSTTRMYINNSVGSGSTWTNFTTAA